MQADNVDAVLFDGLLATLSELCFATPEGLCFDAARTRELGWLVQVEAADRVAVLWLAASSPALERLAANMLGLDAEPTRAHCDDALREIANVLAGRVVRALCDDSALDRVSLPASLSSEAMPALLATASASSVVEVEGGLVLAALRLRDPT